MYKDALSKIDGPEFSFLAHCVLNYARNNDFDIEFLEYISKNIDVEKFKLYSVHSRTSTIVFPILNILFGQSNDIKTKFEKEIEDYKKIRVRNSLRNTIAIKRITDICKLLNREGITPIAIKGSIRLFDNLWPENQDREMGDIDLWVEPPNTIKAYNILTDNSYTTSYNLANFSNSHQLPPLYYKGSIVPVELHKEPGQKRLTKILKQLDIDKTKCISEGSLIKDGQELRSPNIDFQFIQCSVHTSSNMFNGYNKVLPIRDMVECLLLDTKCENTSSSEVYVQDLPLRTLSRVIEYLTMPKEKIDNSKEFYFFYQSKFPALFKNILYKLFWK